MRKTKIIVVSGPSGAGKTTVLKKLFASRTVKKFFTESVSLTTRPSRGGEKNGEDYFFVKKADFRKKREEGFFLETQKVFDNYYGTPKYFLREAEEKNKDLVISIDVKGAMRLKKTLKDFSLVMIFISVEKEEDLLKRLKMRREDSDNIVKRVNLSKKELKFSRYYDYLLVNNDADETARRLKDILIKEREKNGKNRLSGNRKVTKSH